MQDPIYRLDVAHLSMGYAQVPTTSYCLDNTGITPSIYPEAGDTFFPFMLTIIESIGIVSGIISFSVFIYWYLKRKTDFELLKKK